MSPKTKKTKPTADIDIQKSLTEASKQVGRKTSGLSLEMIKLMLGKGKIKSNEYFYFQLYKNELSEKQKAEFLGHSTQTRIFAKVTDIIWAGVAHDKLLFYLIMNRLGLPTPQPIAIVHPARRVPGIRTLSNVAEVVGFLCQGDIYPCFAKPITGMFSQGVMAFKGFDTSKRALIDRQDLTHDPEAVSRSLLDNKEGYLLQNYHSPHPDIFEVCGDRLATVRMIVMLRESGPQIFRALWKIPAGENIADNYWRPGNILAALNHDTGQVTRVVRGYGIQLDHPENHPDTGQPLLGRTLPHWQDLVGFVLKAAPQFAGLGLQAWDVAIVPDGPLAIELNVGGDFDLPQLAHGRGMMDAEFERFIAERSALRNIQGAEYFLKRDLR